MSNRKQKIVSSYPQCENYAIVVAITAVLFFITISMVFGEFFKNLVK